MRVWHAVWTHQLVTAEIQPRTEGRIVGCLLCGAFAWKRRGKLVETCPRRPTTQYMRAQLDKLKDQCFPGEQRKALGPLRQPEPAELEWLARCDRAPQGAKVLAAAALEEKSNQRALTRQELLREFGIRAKVTWMPGLQWRGPIPQMKMERRTAAIPISGMDFLNFILMQCVDVESVSHQKG